MEPMRLLAGMFADITVIEIEAFQKDKKTA